MTPAPRETRIRERALQLYLERVARGETGSALGDWTLAEQQIDFEEEERDRHDDPRNPAIPR